MNSFVTQLATAVAEGEDLESLVPPLLELLESVTGLESTYLTRIDSQQGVQVILFARNTKSLTIPEGLSVPWEDTLCKRALESRQTYTDHVASLWGDSEAAAQLGITTYLSEPIHTADNQLFGTLCGASKARVPLSDNASLIIAMFAKLIARQLERDQLLARLQAENREYSRYALTDPLTGIPNRRALTQALTRALANARRENTAVHLAFIDLDGFKSINDQYGHDAGDRFLIGMAVGLENGLREGDFVARYGGDEFVVFGPAVGSDEPGRDAMHKRLQQLTRGEFSLGDENIDYPGASVGVVTSQPNEDPESLLSRADEVMYQIKKTRRK